MDFFIQYEPRASVIQFMEWEEKNKKVDLRIVPSIFALIDYLLKDARIWTT